MRFLPGGDRLAVVTENKAYLIATPREVSGDITRVRRWAETRSGWTLDVAGVVARLTAAEWERRRQETFEDIDGTADSGAQEAGDRDRHLAIALASRLNHDDFAALWHLDRLLAGGAGAGDDLVGEGRHHARLSQVPAAINDLDHVLSLSNTSSAGVGSNCFAFLDLPESDRLKATAPRRLAVAVDHK